MTEPTQPPEWTTSCEEKLTSELTTELPAELSARMPTVADLNLPQPLLKSSAQLQSAAADELSRLTEAMGLY